MAGIDSEKIARKYVHSGDYKRAADFYAQAGNLREYSKYYEKALESTDDRSVVNDIQSRLRKLNLSGPIWDRLINKAKKRSLERHVGYSRIVAGIATLSLLGSLLSISMNLTGNVIGGSSDNNNWISIGLFFLGCALTLFYFKAKNRDVKTKSKKKKK